MRLPLFIFTHHTQNFADSEVQVSKGTYSCQGISKYMLHLLLEHFGPLMPKTIRAEKSSYWQKQLALIARGHGGTFYIIGVGRDMCGAQVIPWAPPSTHLPHCNYEWIYTAGPPKKGMITRKQTPRTEGLVCNKICHQQPAEEITKCERILNGKQKRRSLSFICGLEINCIKTTSSDILTKRGPWGTWLSHSPICEGKQM